MPLILSRLGLRSKRGIEIPPAGVFETQAACVIGWRRPSNSAIHFDGWYQYAIWCRSLLKLGSWLVFSPPNIHTTPVSRHSLPSLLPHASTHPRKPASFGPMVIEGRLPVREFPTFRITYESNRGV